MPLTRKDKNKLVVNLIDEPMLVGDTPGPKARQIPFEGFGLALAFKGRSGALGQ
jgi:hypothetical protein